MHFWSHYQGSRETELIAIPHWPIRLSYLIGQSDYPIFQVSERSCLKTNKVDGFWEWHLRLFSDLHVQTYTHTSTHIHTQVYTILVTFPDLKSRSLENGMYLVLWGCEENWSHQDRVTWLCRTRPTKYWMPTSRWPLCIFVRAIYLWFAQWKQPGPEIRTGDWK